MSMPNNPLDSLFLCVTPIKLPGGGHATGTLFRYEQEGEEIDYLVTNRHVFVEENDDGEEEFVAEEARIYLRDNADAPMLRISRALDLVKDGERQWMEHSAEPQPDLAVLELYDDLDDYINQPIGPPNFLPDERPITAGEEAMIVGYPVIEPNDYMPIIRSALISSHYGGGFMGNLAFATDANTHSGMSGSPIFTTPSIIDQMDGGPVVYKKPQRYFLGIHSSTLQSPTHSIEEGPLNVNFAFYPEQIIEIIENSEE